MHNFKIVVKKRTRIHLFTSDVERGGRVGGERNKLKPANHRYCLRNIVEVNGLARYPYDIECRKDIVNKKNYPPSVGLNIYDIQCRKCLSTLGGSSARWREKGNKKERGCN